MVIPALASALVFAVAGGPEAGSADNWRSPATRCEVMASTSASRPHCAASSWTCAGARRRSGGRWHA